MLTASYLSRIVETALDEDAPWGDVTSVATIPQNQRGSANIVARHAGVMACGNVVTATYAAVDASIRVNLRYADGRDFVPGAVLVNIEGPLRSILTGERVALNLLQRACAVATTTREYVTAAGTSNTRIIDTRKTTPGLRALEKAAVVCGGGHNHRFSLSDAVLIKDNHIAAWRARGVTVQAGLTELKATLPHTTHVEIEVDDLTTLGEVMETGIPDSVLLDNFSTADIEVAQKIIDGRCLTEVSGGVTLNDVVAIAATGVDVISVGALTQDTRAIDLGMDVVTE